MPKAKSKRPGFSLVGLETSSGTHSHTQPDGRTFKANRDLLISAPSIRVWQQRQLWFGRVFCTRICFNCCNFSFSNVFSTFKKVTFWKEQTATLLSPLVLTWRSVSKVSAPLSLPAKSMKLILPCSWNVTQRCRVGFGGSGRLSRLGSIHREFCLHQILWDCSPTSFFWGDAKMQSQRHLKHIWNATTVVFFLAPGASWEDKSFKLIWRIAWDLDLGFTSQLGCRIDRLGVHWIDSTGEAVPFGAWSPSSLMTKYGLQTTHLGTPNESTLAPVTPVVRLLRPASMTWMKPAHKEELSS